MPMKTVKKHFPVIIEVDEDGVFIVSCPSFQGCHSYGNTIEEALKNITEAIEMCAEEDQTENSQNQFLGFREIEIMRPAVS